MKVKVLYFAGARDLASVDGESIQLGEGASVSSLAEEIISLHPLLKRIQRSVRYSVNLEVAKEDRALRDGDEVGVLPPVAGG